MLCPAANVDAAVRMKRDESRIVGLVFYERGTKPLEVLKKNGK